MRFEKTKGFYDTSRLGDLLYVFHKNHKIYLNNALLKHGISLIQVLCIVMIYIPHSAVKGHSGGTVHPSLGSSTAT